MSETIRNLGRKGFDIEEVEEAAGTYNDRFEISRSEAGPKGGRPSRILRLKTQGQTLGFVILSGLEKGLL